MPGVLFAQDAKPAAKDPFIEAVRPILAAKCARCHEGKNARGGLDLAPFDGQAKVLDGFRVWDKVIRKVQDKEMPPEGARPLTEDERKTLKEWHHRTFVDLPPRPGPSRPRRLTRTEYRNTLEDLTGIRLRLEHRDTFFHADSDTIVEKQLTADPPGPSGFDNDASVLTLGAADFPKYLRIAEYMVDRLDSEKEAQRKLFAVELPKTPTLPSQLAKQIIERFARRAFRRPVTEKELAPFMLVFQKAFAPPAKKDAQETPVSPADVNRYVLQDGRFYGAVKDSFTAIMVSPRFLYRFETDRGIHEPYRITDHELATRLSYFLWSTMPDDELFRLASEDRLHEGDVLKAQVQRLLSDKRSIALAENFAGQWLGFAQMEKVTTFQVQRPDRFVRTLRSMYREPLLFFDDLVRADRSLLEVIDSRHSFINEELGVHYNLAGYKKVKEARRGGEDVADPLRRIELKDPRRGGVLTMAATLVITSAPKRTSPIRRGVWILDSLLGERPPDPPPNVPPLKEAGPNKGKLTLKEQMNLHRSENTCARCHNRIDPLGLALENFDPLGSWRLKDSNGKIDPTTTLDTGEKISGPAEIKALLLGKYRDRYVRNVVERLLAYSLGRGVHHADRPTIDRIAAQLQTEDYRAAALVKAIVSSVPFQYRED
jgi:hypothetical protein